MRKEDYYPIFSLRIASSLCDFGFEIDHTGVNVKNPKYKVFYFKNTEELRMLLRDEFGIS